MTETMLEVEDLVVEFGPVQAVSGVSFTLRAGETLGLVGESGCGKSSTARAVMQLPRPTSGSVRLQGMELTRARGEALRAVRPKLQMIFQDPVSSLNPRRTVLEIVAAPLEVVGWGDRGSRRERVVQALEAVGLDSEISLDRRPHEFSGGQCQRISIARALVLDPEVLICDEPVSALDVSVQAQILNLLHDMKDRYNLTMLFISHDLAVVKNICDRVAVMYLGKVVEEADSEALYRHPRHHYTRALLAAVPEPDPGVRPDPVNLMSGELPSPMNPPSGCRFRTRCPRAERKCADVEPPLAEIAPRHRVACHFPIAEPAAGA
ncbi:ABC transporter ATP-binding protein [Minwuia thermotolerans]|uniref:Peptide ABC transporter ATP-binding protein n=1 Tax=Minwuia thermotolerans TaxID=2056226 RepID=A0A2M9FVM0_9PROT|nr:oligopeptide/dipeptide ABC transporter ATP-binding protein [Minwuia thermotolerans]PJK27525.1 peptide ABC transporter ATP-binding protein [Minwuia thermotolerans]